MWHFDPTSKIVLTTANANMGADPVLPSQHLLKYPKFATMYPLKSPKNMQHLISLWKILGLTIQPQKLPLRCFVPQGDHFLSCSRFYSIQCLRTRCSHKTRSLLSEMLCCRLHFDRINYLFIHLSKE